MRLVTETISTLNFVVNVVTPDRPLEAARAAGRADAPRLSRRRERRRRPPRGRALRRGRRRRRPADGAAPAADRGLRGRGRGRRRASRGDEDLFDPQRASTTCWPTRGPRGPCPRDQRAHKLSGIPNDAFFGAQVWENVQLAVHALATCPSESEMENWQLDLAEVRRRGPRAALRVQDLRDRGAETMIRDARARCGRLEERIEEQREEIGRPARV